MRRLKEKSRWPFSNRPAWQGGGRGKLLSSLVLLACIGTNLTTTAELPEKSRLASSDPAPHANLVGEPNLPVREYSVPANDFLPKYLASRNQRVEGQNVHAVVSPVRYRTSDGIALPRHATAEDSLTCLALNIYWEARNQSLAGQLAIAQVTMNRVHDRRYSDNVCDVVFEHKQFSWYWDGKPDTPKDTNAWETALLIASAAMDGTGSVEFQGVTHYHAIYSQPFWKDHMIRVAMIGDHVFYAD